MEVVIEDYRKFDLSSGNVCGVLVQYPNTDGQINDYTDMITCAHENGVSLLAFVFFVSELLTACLDIGYLTVM